MLPTGWKETNLGDICTFKYGKSLPKTTRSGGAIPVYGSNGIVGHHDSAITTGQTIIIGRKGSYGEINFSENSCWPIDTAYFVDETSTEQDLKWLSYRLASLGLNQLNKAAAIPGLNREDAYRQELLVPPLPEQRRIAAILDQADALRTKRREALAELDSLTQSIFIDMFGNPVFNPMNFPVKTLKQLGKVKTGGTPPGGKDGMFGGNIPFITPGDLGSNKPAKRTVTELGANAAETVRSGSALVCCIGATIGKMEKAKNNSAFNQQINAVEWSNTIDDDYGINALKFFKLQIVAEGASTTLPILKKSSFEKIAIPVPSIDLQNIFAKKLQAIENIRESYRCSFTELDALFSSLQHRAFQGNL
jgi:type I restriction enzyme S subunit